MTSPSSVSFQDGRSPDCIAPAGTLLIVCYVNTVTPEYSVNGVLKKVAIVLSILQLRKQTPSSHSQSRKEPKFEPRCACHPKAELCLYTTLLSHAYSYGDSMAISLMRTKTNAFWECVVVHVAKPSISVSFRITRYICCGNPQPIAI